jgi:hypothetical protein
LSRCRPTAAWQHTQPSRAKPQWPLHFGTTLTGRTHRNTASLEAPRFGATILRITAKLVSKRQTLFFRHREPQGERHPSRRQTERVRGPAPGRAQNKPASVATAGNSHSQACPALTGRLDLVP